jgi:NTE family protein/lysophospholipid hydrolase
MPELRLAVGGPFHWLERAVHAEQPGRLIALAGHAGAQLRPMVRSTTPAKSAWPRTLPISSLLAGKKLDRVLHAQLGDADIEDLWLPFFCVSTDLARARMIVHERGRLWKAVRASCSIPGIFPPLPMDGMTLVDGGLVDNLPLDLLVERCPGPLIAVDVFPYGDPNFEQPSGRLARWLRALRTRIRQEPASPPLFDILVRSTLLGSKFRQGTALARSEPVLYLEPPVAHFGALQWRAHRAVYDAGYAYASEQLARHGAPFAERR